MFAKILKSFMRGLTRVKKKATGKDLARAKRTATKRVKKIPAKLKTKATEKVHAKSQAKTPSPFMPEANDPAHSPGHRKMNWKKYQETSKVSRRSARP